MTETDLPYNTSGDPESTDTVILAGALRPDLVFIIIFPKKLSLGPKNGLSFLGPFIIERRPSRFSSMCAENQVLKLNIGKVTVILRHKSSFLALPPVLRVLNLV